MFCFYTLEVCHPNAQRRPFDGVGGGCRSIFDIVDRIRETRLAHWRPE